jgi:hypothetical protein
MGARKGEVHGDVMGCLNVAVVWCMPSTWPAVGVRLCVVGYTMDATKRRSECKHEERCEVLCYTSFIRFSIVHHITTTPS